MLRARCQNPCRAACASARRASAGGMRGSRPQRPWRCQTAFPAGGCERWSRSLAITCTHSSAQQHATSLPRTCSRPRRPSRCPRGRAGPRHTEGDHGSKIWRAALVACCATACCGSPAASPRAHTHQKRAVQCATRYAQTPSRSHRHKSSPGAEAWDARARDTSCEAKAGMHPRQKMESGVSQLSLQAERSQDWGQASVPRHGPSCSRQLRGLWAVSRAPF